MIGGRGRIAEIKGIIEVALEKEMAKGSQRHLERNTRS